MHNRPHSIELLPQPVVEKIAAGEVIERPASVLKELIENAIDAGATAIDAAIDDAGFSRIVITDNGSGMSEVDLGKSLLAHTTSKIRSAEDLFAIATMGFRGEALASIAAVSRMSVASSDGTNGLGYEISAEGGVRSETRPVAHARGTTIEVRDLFYNVPARKKFMKSGRGEQSAIVRVLEQLAVPFPAIHFTLTVDGKRMLDFPSVATLLARIGAIGGTDFATGLIECENSRIGLDAKVFVSSPQNLTARPRFQSLYVNLRRVDNDSVTFSIREAFSQFLSTQFRPSFFCFLTIDPSSVDVNVHPTKQQVKFEDERSLFGFVFSAVKKGLGARQVGMSDIMTSADADMPNTVEGEGKREISGRTIGSAVQEKMEFPVRESLLTNRFSVPGATRSDPHGNAGAALPPEGTTAAPDQSPRQGSVMSGQIIVPFPNAFAGGEKGGDAKNENGVSLSREQEDITAPWDLISCYQIHEMYILAPIKNGILLIDQHAAHERVLFEQALEDCVRGRSASQQLLFPVVIELSLFEKSLVTSGLDFFTAFGFEISDFGGNALSVSAIPFFMKTGDVDETVRSMVRYLLEEKERDALRETEKRFAAAFACGAAIKAGQKLSQEEMNALVNSLFAAKNPYTCPHGRPTLVRISLDELSRRFLR
jgi:DNA mismatch repair protein MutL